MSARGAAGDAGIVPERLTLNGRVLDRRAFLGAMGLTAAGSLVAGHVWAATAVEAQGGSSRWQAAAGQQGDWHVDDMWGHWPRYAHPIPYSSVHHPLSWDNVALADRLFVM
jgi:hypothetical protein